jgi:hypothetical protein
MFVFVEPPAASAGCPGGGNRNDISVTTEVIDLDPSGNPYTFASDGGGKYFNGVDGVTSILTANTYNCVKTGDWQFNKPGTKRGKPLYSNRKMAVSLNTFDAIVAGDPHYTVDATPPFWGTQTLNAFGEVKCSYVNVSMGQMAANTATTCPTLFAFFMPNDDKWALSPGYSYFGYPEITDAQVSCTAADAQGCKDWLIEPIGSLQAVARLVLEGGTNHGDFYMRFKFHITRP